MQRSRYMLVLTVATLTLGFPVDGSAQVEAVKAPPGVVLQEKGDAWERSILESSAELTTLLLRAFPRLEAEKNAEAMPFLMSLRATGLGATAPAAPRRAGARRRGRRGGFDVSALFERLDANGDGKLSIGELGSHLAASEAAKDGVVTKEELAQIFANRRRGGWRRGRGGRHGRRGRRRASGKELAMSLDRNQDGSLTRLEVQEAVTAAVRKALEPRRSLDADGDAVISLEEYAMSRPQRPGRTGVSAHTHSHFNREDSNRDGSLSLAEVSSRAVGRLEALVMALQLAARVGYADQDQDGFLSLEELSRATKVPTNARDVPMFEFGERGIAVKSVYWGISRASRAQRSALDEQLK